MSNHNIYVSLLSRVSPENPFFQDFSVQTNQEIEIPCRLKNPCKGCGGKSGIISPVDRATGSPHSYRLECGDCGRFQRWVSQREFNRKIGKQGDRDNA